MGFSRASVPCRAGDHDPVHAGKPARAEVAPSVRRSFSTSPSRCGDRRRNITVGSHSPPVTTVFEWRCRQMLGSPRLASGGDAVVVLSRDRAAIRIKGCRSRAGRHYRGICRRSARQSIETPVAGKPTTRRCSDGPDGQRHIPPAECDAPGVEMVRIAGRAWSGLRRNVTPRPAAVPLPNGWHGLDTVEPSV